MTDEQMDVINERKVNFDRLVGEISDTTLGALLREYLAESDHAGWEGYTFKDMLGVSALLEDMATYHSITREE